VYKLLISLNHHIS